MSKRGSSKTLDTQHNSILTAFQDEQDITEKKQQLLNKIKDQISHLTRNALSNLSEEDFQSYLNLMDQQTQLEKDITMISKSYKEIDYYVANADIIFKYYDIVENGNIAENETAATVTEHSILKFFSSHKDTDDVGKENNTNTILLQDEDRASLLDRYMQHTDGNYLKSLVTEESDFCPVCESKNRTLLVNDGITLCNECYTIETVIVDHEKPSYRDPPKEIESNRSQKLMLVATRLRLSQTAGISLGIHQTTVKLYGFGQSARKPFKGTFND